MEVQSTYTSDKYKVYARGRCPLCGDYVWTDQRRSKCKTGTYYHDKCPSRCGGLIEDIVKWDAYWADRAKRWDLEVGKDVFNKTASSV